MRTLGLLATFAALMAVTGVVVVLAAGAFAAPAQFTLTFDGAHVTDPASPVGLRHEGRFTASPPFCSSGRAYDVRWLDTGSAGLAVDRLHTCDDGSGSFTAFMPADVANEHGGRGSWKIVEGTGKYAQLRGQGTYLGTLVSGDPNNFPTIVYRTQWQGVVDFDADAPVVAIPSASATKVPKRVGTYTLRVTVTVQEPSTPVSYHALVHAGKTSIIPLAQKVVSTTTGAVVTLRVSVRTARSVQVAVAATDALGNGPTTASRRVRLPR
jgi:hypothetical protein